MANSAAKRVDYIDLLRIIAITFVAIFHFLYSAIVNNKTPSLSPSPLFETARYGYLGVELFFMISGYVVVATVQRSNLIYFLRKRFLRLYPMYWIALVLIFAISSLGIWKKAGPAAQTFYYNLTMFPKTFNEPWIDNAHWFMERQLQLYLALSLVLLLRLGKRIDLIFTYWAIIGFVWHQFGIENFNIWYLNGYFALISGGALIAIIRTNGFNLLRVLALLASFLWAIETRMAKVDWFNSSRSPGYSKTTIGLVVAAIYLLMLISLIPKISTLKLSWAVKAGVVTYPFYLIHDRVGGLILGRFATEGNKYFMYLTVIALAVGLARIIMRIESKIFSLFTFPRTKSRLAE